MPIPPGFNTAGAMSVVLTSQTSASCSAPCSRVATFTLNRYACLDPHGLDT